MKIKNFADSEKNLRESMRIFESFRQDIYSSYSDLEKVLKYDQNALVYRNLQELLVEKGRFKEGLEMSERGRARAFVELLVRQSIAKPTDPIDFQPPSIDLIQRIAKIQKATLVEYSIIAEELKIKDKVQIVDSKLFIWVVSPSGEVSFRPVNLLSKGKPLRDFVTSSRISIGARGRGSSIVLDSIDSVEKADQLKQLHELMIRPIYDLLPTNSEDRIIFVPQGILSLVPFPALQDTTGKYLIEKHTILTVPAIQVLDLTHQ
ncbi:MAG: CHAT domain-containing protein [Phormidesmis sp. CAN_BIN36]|nr:CHAT domain-containing protein [Phormidesmis sp. CAN_BIN36]